MLTTIANSLRSIHEDERGDVLQNICVGGAGGLGCIVLFKVLQYLLEQVLQPKLSNMIGGTGTEGSWK